MTQSVEGLSCKREDLSLILEMHIKSQAWWPKPRIPVLWRQAESGG